ncbi:hypothetical protein MPH_00713 [Macrophomina phaseolina MS6]|uniref:DUF7029 domain-containing protein n=1 Tax=Macrophomina phaseolina (strain MS6) TaxID=1126212 RepID=K2SH45_MACPH|nr:hypothetical protein MPH_00713 [Macrophomina phaseolina MS6]
MRSIALITSLMGLGTVAAVPRYQNLTSSAVQSVGGGVYHTTVVDTVYKTVETAYTTLVSTQLTTKVEIEHATKTETAYVITTGFPCEGGSKASGAPVVVAAGAGSGSGSGSSGSGSGGSGGSSGSSSGSGSRSSGQSKSSNGAGSSDIVKTSGSGSSKSDGNSGDVVIGSSSWTTTQGPITTLMPAAPPGHDKAALSNLAPKDTGSIYFNDGSSGGASAGSSKSNSTSSGSAGFSGSTGSSGSAGSSGSTGFTGSAGSSGSSSSNGGQLFALMQANFTYPSIILDNSQYILSISCVTGGLQIAFSNAEAFKYAQNAWGTAKQFVIVTSSVSCGSAPAGQHTYWLVAGVVFSESSHTAQLDCSELPIEKAIGDVTVTWGTTITSNSTLNGTTAASGNSTYSYGGSGYSNSTGSSSTSGSSSGSSCSTPPAATISGFPAAPCGDGFDKALDDKLGYYDFTSDFSGSLEDIAPGLGDYSASDYGDDDVVSSARRRRSLSHTAHARAVIEKRLFGISIKAVFQKVAPKLTAKIEQKIDAVKNFAIKTADKYTNGAVSKGIKFISDKIDSLTTAKAGGNININLTPKGLVDSKYWGQQYRLYHGEKTSGAASGSVDLYCVDCGITGKAHIAGELGFSLLGGGFNKGSVTVDGSLKAGLFLGLAAEGQYKNTFKKTITSDGLPGFSIHNVITVGPVVAMDASLALDIKAQGQILVGGSAEINNFYAKLDVVNSDQTTATGFKPTFNSKFTAAGQISADARVGLPLTVGVGLEITPLKYRKLISITNEPYVSASATYAYDSVNPGTCNNGIQYQLTLGDELSMNFFDIKTMSLFKADMPPLAADCIKLGGSSGSSDPTSSGSTSGSGATDSSSSGSPSGSSDASSSGSTSGNTDTSTSGSGSTIDGSAASGSTANSGTTDGSTSSGSTTGSSNTGSSDNSANTGATDGSTSSGAADSSANAGQSTSSGTIDGISNADIASQTNNSGAMDSSASTGATDSAANAGSADTTVTTGSSTSSGGLFGAVNSINNAVNAAADTVAAATANIESTANTDASVNTDSSVNTDASVNAGASVNVDASASIEKRSLITRQDASTTTSSDDAVYTGDGGTDFNELSNIAYTDEDSTNADGKNDDGFTYTNVIDSTGAWYLSADADGALNLQAAADAASDGGVTFATYDNLTVSDDQDRVFHYHPDTMAALGVSRFRIGALEELPKGADMITLAPIDTDGSAETKGVVVALNSEGNAFYTVVCNVGDAAKVFLVADPDAGAAALEREGMQWIVTGGVATDCSAMAFTNGVGGGIS